MNESRKKRLGNILGKFSGKPVFVEIEKWNDWNNVNGYNNFEYEIRDDNIEIHDGSNTFCVDINRVGHFKYFGSNVRINLGDGLMLWVVKVG